MVPSNENQSQQLDWLQAPDEDQDRDSASDEDMDVDDGEQGGPAQRLANEDVSENEEAPKSRRDIVRLAQRMKAEVSSVVEVRCASAKLTALVMFS